MEIEEKLKTYKGYFESIGMEVSNATEVLDFKKVDDDILERVKSGIASFDLDYENSYYELYDKKWHKGHCFLRVDILPNGWWSIDTADENLGYYTEEIAKTILEKLVNCK